MAKLTSEELKQRVQQLEETGGFGGFIDGDEIGQVLDFYNQQVEKQKEKDFNKKVTKMNKFYKDLAVWAVLHPGEDYKSTGTVTVTHKKDDEE